MTTETLTFERANWSAEAAQMLTASTRRAPLTTAADYRDLLAVDPTAHLYRVSGDAGTVGFVLIRTEHFSGGREGVIVAAAGRLPGVDLVEAILPTIEGEFNGVDCYRFATARTGLVRKMKRQGYQITHVVMRKVARP